MVSMTKSTLITAFAALVNAHAVILNAQGSSGPASVGFKVEPSIARNCTGIKPCQLDTTIIRDAEISANVVNECGRTELSGNIDVGESTESALSAKAVTQAKPGDKVTVTIHQVNADGAGPFVCDMDMTGNTLGVSGQTPLEVQNNVPGVNGFSQAKTQQFNITVTMPDNMNCTGASTGNVCTVRCRNNALAGPFGGCFPVQQVSNSFSNSAKTIDTAANLKAIEDQVLSSKADLPAAIAANEAAGLSGAVEDVAVLSTLLATFPSSTFPQETPNAGGLVDSSATTTAASNNKATATSTAAKATATNKNTGNKNGNANTGNKATTGNTGNGNKATTGNGNKATTGNAGNKATTGNTGNNKNFGRRDGKLRWSRRASTEKQE